MKNTKIIFKEIYNERELIMNSMWNWIHKWNIYDRVVIRKKTSVIKDAPDYELIIENFKESDLEVMMKEVITYSKTELYNFFDKNENIDDIIIPTDIIVDNETFKYSVGIYKDAYNDIYPVVKTGY